MNLGIKEFRLMGLNPKRKNGTCYLTNIFHLVYWVIYYHMVDILPDISSKWEQKKNVVLSYCFSFKIDIIGQYCRHWLDFIHYLT